jgi:hypothetical protein
MAELWRRLSRNEGGYIKESEVSHRNVYNKARTIERTKGNNGESQ